MRRIWVHFGAVCVLLGLLIGCKSSTPELKPPTQPEEFNAPPAEARFNSPNYPKEALARDDVTKKLRDSGMPKGGFGPGGGAMAGMNGMGGMR